MLDESPHILYNTMYSYILYTNHVFLSDAASFSLLPLLYVVDTILYDIADDIPLPYLYLYMAYLLIYSSFTRIIISL